MILFFQNDLGVESHWTNVSHMSIPEQSMWQKNGILWLAKPMMGSALQLESGVNHSHATGSHGGLWVVLQSKSQALLSKGRGNRP